MRPSPLLVLVATTLAACGTPVRPLVSPPAPGELVIAHFVPSREVRLERGPGDTVRVRDATSVLGRLRAMRGDTAWIAATRVRSLHDDGQGTVPGWTTAIVNGGRTQVVPLSRDTYTDRKGAGQLGILTAIGVSGSLLAYFLYAWAASGS